MFHLIISGSSWLSCPSWRNIRSWNTGMKCRPADPELTFKKAEHHLDDLTAGRKENPYFLDKYPIFAAVSTSAKRGVVVWDWDSTCVAILACTRWEQQWQTFQGGTAVQDPGIETHGFGRRWILDTYMPGDKPRSLQSGSRCTI